MGIVLFDQNADGSNKNKSKESGSKLIIARGNTSEKLELEKEAFNQMAFLVMPPIALPRLFDTGFRRDVVAGALRTNVLSNFLGAICFVAKYYRALYPDMGQYVNSNSIVIDITG